MYLFKGYFIPLLILFHLSSFDLFAQGSKSLEHSDYDSWNELSNQEISRDGKFIAYEINPQKGDGNLFLYDVDQKDYDRFHRGSDPVFSPKSNFLVYRIKPAFDTVRELKLKKVKKDKLPKDSLGVLVMGTEANFIFPGLKSVQVPKEEGEWLAALLEPFKEKEKEGDTASSQKAERKNGSKKKNGKKDDNDLLLFNPVDNDTLLFEHVKEYTVSRNGKTIAFVQVKKDSIDSVSVSFFDTRKNKHSVLFEKQGYIAKIGIDHQGNQLAFLYSDDTAKAKVYSLKYVELKNGSIRDVPVDAMDGAIEGWSASEDAVLYFHEDGKELYFGTAEKPEPEVKDTLTGDEKVSVDIWNWKDPLLQPQQLKELEKEKKRTYSAVYFPDKNRSVQLATPSMKDIDLDIRARGPLSLSYDRDPYLKYISWESSRYKDVYLVNRNTGERKKILEKTASTVRLSPFQHYVGWYNIVDSSWYIYDVRNETLANVTGNIGVPFYNEQHDIPDEAGPYGMAGWTKDEQMIIYDRYDLWQIDPSGKKAPVNLTGGEGRSNKIRFRYLRLDPEEIHLPEDMLLRAFNESNKKAGYYALNTRNNSPGQLIYGDFYFRRVMKAREADRIIWTKESFTLFPDLYTSDTRFNDPKKITEANPQQKDYIWGTTELVRWVNFDGDSLEGILVKPENFDPEKKYPMLVYFYERSSNRLNVYYTPKPIRSTINWTYYASNGYIIFIPDIIYKTGYPGPSAFNCIISGTQEMCNRYSFIDRNRLGIQGQSWGGYQTAYIITQTDMFAAAMAGAPVSNMTSAYGGIRWGTGLSRAFQYEESQSRIGATLWERRDLYILNSPLFFANQVNTPLLMMHNDEDGAVPWYQGIEFFNALRRLDKPVWMLVYNKAPHNLRRRADMEDLTIRMQQFFDHFLKDAPEPVWMYEGIPALKKGKEMGYELIEE